MPIRKTLHAKWDKLRGRSPTPEPQHGQEQLHRSSSTPPAITATDYIPSQPNIDSSVAQTSLYPSRTSGDTPHPSTESSSSSAEISIAQKVTGGPPSRTPSDPQEAIPDEHGEGLEGCLKANKEGYSNTRDIVTGAVRLALDITESLSEGVPFLPGAIKALKTVVEAYEVRRLRSKAVL